MHRRGHDGITLLAFAPIAYLLLRDNSLALAVLGWVGVHAVERLPDQDFWLPGLHHRGISHSVTAALVVGSVIGGAGWILTGQQVNLTLTTGPLLSVLSDLLTARFDVLIGSVPTPLVQTASEIVAPLIHDLDSYRLRTMSDSERWSVALFGFFVGVYGIGVHLLGDIITTNGIRPFLPFSSYQISPSPLRADSPTVNEGLFILGVGAMCLAVGLAVGPSIEVMIS
jgi:membrane-bound metal-dependent hydrolase YbcI (DUF457 family)